MSILNIMGDFEVTRCSILIEELFSNGIITETQKNESKKYMENIILKNIKEKELLKQPKQSI